jgi:hypothetical protein
MIKKLLTSLAMLCAFAGAQVAVAPIVQPHMVFNDNTGLACAGCSLYSYAAGTTTPRPTYTDSTGTSQNTNPIVLGTDGGANIWLGANSYKLVLINSLGTTVFSVDNINTAGLSACATAGAIAFENTALNGLTCDSTITINPSTHAINVGTLPPSHVTMLALGTPTTWTFDITTPATALASLGGTVIPYPAAGIPTSTGTAWGTSYGTSGTGNVALTTAPVFVTPTLGAANATSVQIASGTALSANQGTGASVQHSTGAAVPGDCTKFDSTGNTIDAGGACATITTPTTCNANGCYSIDGAGYITAWGKSTNGTGSGSANTLTITFPVAFTTTTNLQVVVSPTGSPGGDGNPHPLDCHIESQSTTAAQVILAIPSQIGGSGYSSPILTSQYCSWHAFGH